MNRIIAFAAALVTASAASAETVGTNPVIMCPGGAVVIQMDDAYRCLMTDGNLITPKIGLSVWAPLVNPVSSDCAPGYWKACDARDHGARPIQPFGGGR